MEEDPMAPIFEEEDDTVADSAIREAKIKADIYRVIKNWTFTMPNLDSTSKGFNVTPKVAKLVQILQCFQHEGDAFRGVIFGRCHCRGGGGILILMWAYQSKAV